MCSVHTLSNCFPCICEYHTKRPFRNRHPSEPENGGVTWHGQLHRTTFCAGSRFPLNLAGKEPSLVHDTRIRANQVWCGRDKTSSAKKRITDMWISWLKSETTCFSHAQPPTSSNQKLPKNSAIGTHYFTRQLACCNPISCECNKNVIRWPRLPVQCFYRSNKHNHRHITHKIIGSTEVLHESA